MKFGYFDDNAKEYVITSPKNHHCLGLITSAVKISFH